MDVTQSSLVPMPPGREFLLRSDSKPFAATRASGFTQLPKNLEPDPATHQSD